MSDSNNSQPTLQGSGCEDLERQQVIQRYIPLVIKIASGLTGRYIEMGRDEEISVGLLALNEAIDKYDATRGASFATFANLVVANRLRDYLRRQNRRELPASSITEQLPYLDCHQAWHEYWEQQILENRRSEVLDFAKQLAKYKLDLKQLAAATPKHRQSRQRAMVAAKILATCPRLCQHVWKKKSLPLKELEQQLSVSRKTLERQRKYIIALFVVLTGDYQYLAEYLPCEADENG